MHPALALCCMKLQGRVLSVHLAVSSKEQNGGKGPVSVPTVLVALGLFS